MSILLAIGTKTIIGLLFCLFIPNGRCDLYAQNGDFEQRLRRTPALQQAATLNTHAYTFRGHAPQQMQAFSERALLIAREHRQQQEEMTAFLHLSDAARRLGNMPRALQRGLEGLKTAEAIQHSIGIIRALNLVANAYRLSGNNKLAIDHATRALKLSRVQNDKEWTATSLNVLGLIYRGTPKALEYLLQAADLYEHLRHKEGLGAVYNSIGEIHRGMANFSRALEYYDRSLRLKRQDGNRWGAALTLKNMMATFVLLKDTTRALDYHRQCIELCRQTGDSSLMASAYYDLGDLYRNLKRYHQAVDYHLKALEIREIQNHNREIIMTLRGLGQDFEEAGQFYDALQYQEKALNLAQHQGDSALFSSSYLRLGNIYRALGNPAQAKLYLLRALTNAERFQQFENVRRIYETLIPLYEHLAEKDSAYTLYKRYAALKDIIALEERKRGVLETQIVYDAERKEQEIALLQRDNAITSLELRRRQMDIQQQQQQMRFLEQERTLQHYTLAQKRSEAEKRERENALLLSEKNAQNAQLERSEAEAARQRVLRNSLIVGLFTALLLVVLLLNRYRLQQRSEKLLQEKNTEIEAQRERADLLLHSILPLPIARRMIRGEQSIADYYDNVTVLFADIAGFTTLANQQQPHELVAFLDTLFSHFDQKALDYGLEKIKTIGDSYMLVGGLPSPVPDHCERVAGFALDILDLVQQPIVFQGIKSTTVQIRIGIHTGAVVAGIIGKHKFAYDLWGDAVNTASRMESHAEPGTIHCTEEVFHHLQHTFRFIDRGFVEIKDKGLMHTYYLTANGKS